MRMKPASTTRSGWWRVDFGGERRIERGAVRECAMVDHGGAMPRFAATADRCLRIVADDRGDRVPAAGLEQGLHVAAAPGDQDDDAFQPWPIVAGVERDE